MKLEHGRRLTRTGLAVAIGLAMVSGAHAQDAPKVVATFPPTDAVVPAGIQQISVTYDRPMAETWSFVTGGEKAFPEIDGGPSRSDDHRTISLPVKLRPNSTYVIWLNTERYHEFKDEAGHSATPYRLAFTTSE